MKRFAAVTLAALMLLTVFASAASAAAVNDSLEIRGPVYNGSNINDILAKELAVPLQWMLVNLQHSSTILTTT